MLNPKPLREEVIQMIVAAVITVGGRHRIDRKIRILVMLPSAKDRPELIQGRKMDVPVLPLEAVVSLM